MTVSLCLNCGQMKSGALVPCSECGHDAGNDDDLKLVLTDWFCDWDELSAIGHMVQEISKHCDDPHIRHCALVQYLIKEYPRILGGACPEDDLEEVDAVLRQCAPPPLRQKTSDERVAGEDATNRSMSWDDDGLP